MIDTYFYNVTHLIEIIEENKKKFKRPDKTRILSKNIGIILGEKATARYPIAAREIKDDRFLMRFKKRHGFLFWLWWLFANCGRSFLRWAIWCFIFAFIFGFIFSDITVPDWLPLWTQDILTSMNPKIEISPIYRSPTWYTPFYFSIVTFTTLGFGDVTPLNLWGEIWLTLEVILGYVMLGGLISILANKLARRS